ncbi:MAG: type II toxin-antitoxin system RelE/ParE family toxin [Leptospiraceae bacterium]|nr:type II toxin-antitoxin system RelE/ParE family toxin [Leptospiraceae bacterium]
MNKAIFTEEANQDLREAVLWYENQQSGIGKKLAIEVIEKIHKLEIKPDAYSADDKGLRKTSLNSFPYFIYYAFNKSPLVLVIAIWHKSRLKDIVDIRAINISK